MRVKNALLSASPFIATAVMLTVIQAPFSLSALAWVALVPFVLACLPDARPRRLALVTFVVSFFYWFGNIYWMRYVTIAGWISFCLYTALLWPILALSLRYCRRKKLPLFLAVPVLFIAVERLQGLFLGGFYWRFLGHSQYQNITLIQISDIFGAGGVSFLIGMVNGLLAELIIASGRRTHASNRKTLLKAAFVCAAVVAALIYGRWRISQAAQFIRPGPLVASVQSNVPQSIKQSWESSDAIFDDCLAKSRASSKLGAELVIWPETMVQAVLDPDVLKVLDPNSSHNIYDKILREHSRGNTFVLVGAYGGTPLIGDDSIVSLAARRNTAFLYQPDGQKSDKQYSKIHLVPFGEFIPFRKLPLISRIFEVFSPYDSDYSLDPGTEYTIFEMTSAQPPPGRDYRFGIMICYEDAVPAIARRFALDGQGKKQIDWLVNISNDGWFVKFKDDSKSVLPSTELPQHAAICAFRAVENRLAVIRSVNTGISCLIDSLGRIKHGFVHGNLPEEAMARTGIEGFFLDYVPIDQRSTFFSKYGEWLDFCCVLCLVMLIIVGLSQRLLLRKRFGTRLSGRSNSKYARKR